MFVKASQLYRYFFQRVFHAYVFGVRKTASDMMDDRRLLLSGISNYVTSTQMLPSIACQFSAPVVSETPQLQLPIGPHEAPITFH